MQIVQTILLLLFFQIFPIHSGFSEELVLAVGESKQLPKGKNIWVENGKIIRIQENGSGLLLSSVRPGKSELRIGTKSYLVTSLSLRQARTVKLLQSPVRISLNQHLAVSEGNVHVNGRIHRWRDWEALAKACQNKSCQYLYQSEMDPEVFAESQKKILKSLARFSLPKLQIQFGNFYFVKIPQNATYLKPLEEALSAYGIMVIADSAAIDIAPLVKVQITVAEVKRDFMRKYGLKWPSSYTTQLLPLNTPVELNESQIQNTQLNVHALETAGAGRILAMPNILCRSGKEAEFLAGGEFPIKILNMRIQEVIWKKYGVLMKVKPVADHSGRMSISIETEISSIDPSRTVDGIPALFTNRVQSHFDLSQPRTIALSGLIKNEESKNSDGLPWIAKIPILGSLFSSKEFRENKTELVIFVRPEILNPDDAEQEMILPGSVL